MMGNKDNLESISSIISEYLENRGMSPKINNDGIKKVLDESFKNATETEDNNEYLTSVPTIEDLSEAIKKIAETIIKTKEDVDTVNSENLKMYKDIKTLYEKTKKLESEVSKSKKELDQMEKTVNRINNFVVGFMVAVGIAFVVWLIDDYNFRWTKTEELNKEIEKIEMKISEYEQKMATYEEIIINNDKNNEKYVDSKIEALINKSMLEFYKSQGESKK